MVFSATSIVKASTTNVSSNTVLTSLKGNFGRLWRCGHETFTNESRKILSVSGAGATTYLQGLVTSDLLSAPIPPREEVEGNTGDDGEGINYQSSSSSPPPPLVEFSDKIRSTCFLDNKGRIVTDSLLWKLDETHYLIDVPGNMGDHLLQHLKHFKLRKTKVKLKLEKKMSAHVVYGTLNATGTPPGYVAGVDPRHPSLGMRIVSLEGDSDNNNNNNNNNNPNNNLLQLMSKQFPEVPGTYDVVRKLAGVAEGAEINGKIAIEANQEFLNAISFHKGCYLGQELTARVHYTGNVRKRILPIFLIDTNIQIPPPWIIASQIMQQQQQNDDESNTSNQGPRLPRLSPSAAGAIMGMMSGDYDDTGNDADDISQQIQQESPDRSQLRAQADVLMETLQSNLNRGDKIQDTKDGKTIGQIIATPEIGTNVVLAQMRLDRVGLLGDGVWNHTNKITINDQQYRYLPYLPLWWPTFDRSSGKAVE